VGLLQLLGVTVTKTISFFALFVCHMIPTFLGVWGTDKFHMEICIHFVVFIPVNL
jgi:hypothetical protein